jgi:ribonuclease T2
MAISRLPLAGFLALALSVALPGQFHRKIQDAPAVFTPRFDYYILSLSWAPEFCAHPSDVAADNRRECAAGQGVGFVVHGLWPEMNVGAGQESCTPAKPVAKSVIDLMLPYMLSPGLIQHEWSAHGTCTGLTPSAYFSTVLQARAAVQLPVQITSVEQAADESPTLIDEQFAGSNSAFPKGSFRALCRDGALSEVRVCFDKELSPQRCAATAGQCTASSITIKPPR